jgi:hypothetical protein
LAALDNGRVNDRVAARNVSPSIEATIEALKQRLHHAGLGQKSDRPELTAAKIVSRTGHTVFFEAPTT